MPLVTGGTILTAARAGKYGVGAFNTNNLEITQAVLETAEALKSPVILQISEGARKYAGTESLAHMIADMAGRVSVPVAIHLDHGSTFESCETAIDAGFTSVMIDASHDAFDENIRITKDVVDMAHARGVTVEAELGRLGGIEEHVNVSAEDAFLTDPQEALEFIERTGIDYLAVAIGTSHGAYKGKGRPFIDHARIEKIASLTGIPLVMHGASGVPTWLTERFKESGGVIGEAAGIHDEDVSRSTQHGIAKVNIDTDLRLAFTTAVREILNKYPNEFDPRKILGPAKDVMKEIASHRMKVLGSAGKA
jgi:fructose-bisphosphate aldolase, class II